MFPIFFVLSSATNFSKSFDVSFIRLCVFESPLFIRFTEKTVKILKKKHFSIFFLLFSATNFSESRDYSLIRLYVFANPLVLGFTVKNGQNLKKSRFSWLFLLSSATNCWYRQNNVRILISVVNYCCKLIFIEIEAKKF